MKVANKGLIATLLVVPALMALLMNNLMLLVEIIVIQILLGIEIDDVD